MIEAKTYRFDEHAVGLYIPSEYRSEEEVEKYKTTRDPLKLYRQLILDEKLLSDEDLKALEQSLKDQVQEAVDFAKESDFPKPEDLYENMYANPINYP